MGPPPRSLAAEANDCFMVRTPPGTTEYKVAARSFAPYGGLPSVRCCSLYSTSQMEVHGPCHCHRNHSLTPPSSRRATPLPLEPRAPTARSLTPCSAPSRRGLATPTTPDPRRDGQPRPRRRAASSQSCRSGQRNGAQVEQRNNLGPHYKSPLTGKRPIQAITAGIVACGRRATTSLDDPTKKMIAIAAFDLRGCGRCGEGLECLQTCRRGSSRRRRSQIPTRRRRRWPARENRRPRKLR